MAHIDLDVQETTGRVNTIGVDDQMTLEQVAALARESLGLPFKDKHGRTLHYALFHSLEGRFLNPDLAVHGIDPRGRLRILPRAFSELFELELLTAPNPGMLYPLTPHRELSIGRDFGNNIVIRHKVVSRQHGLFTWEDGFHLYMDLNSANGSWLNHHPVTRPMPIASGDILSLGQSVTLVYREREIVGDSTTEEADKALSKIQTEPSRTGLVKIPKGEVFISYSDGQQHLMEAIVTGLTKVGVQSWVNPEDLTSAMQRAHAMIVILSREAVANHALQAEWEAFAAYRKPVVPVLFEPCRIPDLFEDAPEVVEYHYNDQQLSGDVLHALFHVLS